MDALVLSDGKNSLSLGLLAWDGDAYVSVSVTSNGYAGRNDLHVHGPEFQAFCRSLVSMVGTLGGEAQLRSVVPNELVLTIRAADSRGHFAIVGSTGMNLRTNRDEYWHAVHFGFEVDAADIERASKQGWVGRHAV